MKPLSIAMRACLRAAQFLVSSGSTAAGMLWLMSVLTAGPAMANERLMPSEWRLDAAEYSGIACTESGGGWAYNGGVYHAARSDGAPGRPEQYFASYLALVRGSQCSMETACNSKIDWSVTQACEVEAPSSSHGVARCKLQGKYVQKCGWNAPYEVTFEGMVTAWKTCDQYYDPQSRQCVCPEGEVYVKTSGGGYCTPVRDRVIATPCKTCYGNPRVRGARLPHRAWTTTPQATWFDEWTSTVGSRAMRMWRDAIWNRHGSKASPPVRPAPRPCLQERRCRLMLER